MAGAVGIPVPRGQYNRGLEFSVAQLQWLEQQYPQRVLPPTASEAEIHQYFGTQRVLQSIREKVYRG